MVRNRRLEEQYFEWMYDQVSRGRFAPDISYRKLLRCLHGTEFRYIIPKDRNRAKDGIDLRYRFAGELFAGEDVELYLTGPCSVLEMMVALAIRCEEDNMEDTAYGDRTGQWFWGMINNLGLGSMIDSRFDRHIVDDIVERFLDRKYERDGKGGLFRVRHCNADLRTVEIWCQLSWYLDTIM